MEIDAFVKRILSASAKFDWIKSVDVKTMETRAKIRLFLNDNFVDVYYNAEDEIVSYAYIESNKRVFGANNMKIGWHWHPYDDVQKHAQGESVTIETFLKALEKELRKMDKIWKQKPLQ